MNNQSLAMVAATAPRVESRKSLTSEEARRSRLLERWCRVLLLLLMMQEVDKRSKGRKKTLRALVVMVQREASPTRVSLQ
jgi:hypothetical protein